jgi:MtN3 and saliva related transmembrane protein
MNVLKNGDTSSDLTLYIILQIVEWSASILTFVAFIPEIIHTIKNKSTSDTNLYMFLILTIEYGLWIIFDIIIGVWDEDLVLSLGLVICDFVAFCLVAILLTRKIHHIYLAKKMNMTEKQFDKWKIKQKRIKKASNKKNKK